jgi:exonuclease III/hemoglobin-like flavoprotein
MSSFNEGKKCLTKIYSQNCRGLADFKKRRDVLHYLRSKSYNLICLQDLHVRQNLIPYVEKEWGYKAYINSIHGNSRGVGIFINNNFEHTVHQCIRDNNCNFIILDITIEGLRISLVNIYGPNKDSPDFYIQVKKQIGKMENDYVIICGDWNLVLDPIIDTKNYKFTNNPKARREVLNLKTELDLVDVWRSQNEFEKSFTWRQLTLKKHARLDYFLVSESLSSRVSSSEILPGYRTDHSGILLNLTLHLSDRGNGYWKFNSSLLKDTQYISLIKNKIKEICQEYRPENVNPESYEVNDQLLLETILLIIRGETIQYSTIKKRKIHKEELQLENDIKKLEIKINNSPDRVSKNDMNLYAEKKSSMESLRKQKLEGILLRSRCRYFDLGEKPTKYFFGLEKRNYINKSIAKLIDDNGVEMSKISDILNCQQQFYKNLYTQPPENLLYENLNELIGENPRKLDENVAMELEGELTLAELKNALQKMKNNKSPGPDGFPVEFFKFFWPDLSKFILNSLNYGYKNGTLSITQKQGIITCIPKADKDRTKLKNWRPISLLNVVYKLASTCISNRIKKVLNNIIHEDQTGFIASRFMGENVRTTYDILFETKTRHLTGLLLIIDFEKAFDTVSWKFIYKTLEYFNFGPSIKKWIKLFYSDPKSCIIQNGHMSDYFKLNRGCRQGDPISPYLFILCAEILGNFIRNDNILKGININGNEYRLSQFADDTQIFLDGSEKSLRQTINLLSLFHNISGLKTNSEKTRAVWLGSKIGSDEILCRDVPLDWSEKSFKILGVNFTNDLKDIWDINKNEIKLKINKLLNIWNKRNLTPYGKVTVIKSLAISKYIHLFMSLPNPPKEFIKELESDFFKFLWNKGPDRIKRIDAYKNIKNGGLGMLKIEEFIEGLKISWFRRYLKSKHTWANLSNFNILQVVMLGGQYVENLAKRLKNPFWIDLLKAWLKFTNQFKIGETLSSILYSPIFCIAKKQMYFSSWFTSGIHNIIDIYDSNGNIMTFDNLKAQFKVQGTFLHYTRLINSIPKIWRDFIAANKAEVLQYKYNVKQNCYIQHLCKSEKGSKDFYMVLINNINNIYKNVKWESCLGQIPTSIWKKSHHGILLLSETKIRDFQFKINYHILATNTYLKKIGKIESDKCDYCETEKETIYHVLYDCIKINKFWKELQIWLKTNFLFQLDLEPCDLILGTSNQNSAMHNVIMYAKYFIYKTKFHTNKNLTVDAFVNYFQRIYEVEKYLATLKGKLEFFERMWQNVKAYYE